jgi:hypothetical protein
LPGQVSVSIRPSILHCVYAVSTTGASELQIRIVPVLHEAAVFMA